MTTFKTSKNKGWRQAEPTPLQSAQIRIQQLTNDLAAAKKREEGYRATELNMHDKLNALTMRLNLADATINQYRHERDDWREAFRTVSKLVK